MSIIDESIQALEQEVELLKESVKELKDANDDLQGIIIQMKFTVDRLDSIIPKRNYWD